VRPVAEAAELARQLLVDSDASLVCMEDATAAALDDMDEAEFEAAKQAPRAAGFLAAFVRGLLGQRRP
jgi:hypothetical protein